MTKKEAIKKAEERMGMTSEEINQKLISIKGRNKKIALLLKEFDNDYRNWNVHLISKITPELFEKKERTVYIKNGEVIANEKGYQDDDLHLLPRHEVESSIIDEKVGVKTVTYKYVGITKKSILEKIKSGKNLDEDELDELRYLFPEVYREEEESRRWSKYVTVVLNLGTEKKPKLYALNYDEGLTENQPDSFFEQPYEVSLKTEQVVIEQVHIIKKGE